MSPTVSPIGSREEFLEDLHVLGIGAGNLGNLRDFLRTFTLGRASIEFSARGKKAQVIDTDNLVISVAFPDKRFVFSTQINNENYTIEVFNTRNAVIVMDSVFVLKGQNMQWEVVLH